MDSAVRLYEKRENAEWMSRSEIKENKYPLLNNFGSFYNHIKQLYFCN